MRQSVLNFFRALFEETDASQVQSRFLRVFLELQGVERGSIWIKADDELVCVEAAGSQSDMIKGIRIPSTRPSIVGWVIEHGEMTIAEAGKDKRHYKEMEAPFDVKSNLILCFPLLLRDGSIYGAVQIIDTSAEGNRLNLQPEYLELLQICVDMGSVALSNVLNLSDMLHENQRLKKALEQARGQQAIVGQSSAFSEALSLAANYARTDFPVLITGESGTGKEVLAAEIHRQSPRRDKPFLVQNVSAIPDTLLESELFGYAKGAFTGAVKDKIGLFEAADGGTVFLDEIGDMPLNLQARVLRVLQNNEIKPLGQTAARRVDVRIIAATNRDLSELIGDNAFREDLFYRLNVLPLNLPPLRRRVEDIPLLVDYFIRREAARMGIQPKRPNAEAMHKLMIYPWRGNIRELENLVKYFLAAVNGPEISEDDLPPYIAQPGLEGPTDQVAAAGGAALADPFDGKSWDQVEREYARHLLEKHRWNVTLASKEARVNRSTFDSRLKKLGLRRRP